MTLTDVEKWLSTQHEKKLAQGDSVRWALAAHDLAVSNVYAIPEDHQLGGEYVRRNASVVVQQLGAAAIRLASILNEAAN